MKPSAVPGVLASDPTATDPAAYPLTALSYAVAAPSTLDAAAGKDYAAFLRYAAGPGQQPGGAPGQLPGGMAPLPATLKAQTLAAAATIQAQSGHPATATTTTLHVVPQSAFAGIPMILQANVAPRGAAGTIQFMDGTTALGPAVPVTLGTALRITTLTTGAHSLTARFTPSNPAAYSPSTSPPISLTVNSLF
ncbi:MAG: Ig-like domain-containing protein [Pseudonocardiaceae bacterium]